MAKAKATKPKKAVSKNHFKVGPDGIDRTRIGTIVGVETEIEEIRSTDAIKLVGDSRKLYVGLSSKQKTEPIKGIDVPVYVDDRAVYIAPECGDSGLAITRETLYALAEAVKADESA